MNSITLVVTLLCLTLGVRAANDNSEAKVNITGFGREPIFGTYSGYLNATSNGREQYHFYLLTKSQTNTASKDPLILWLNGGPGCSSVGGQFEELGPFHVTKDGKSLWENVYAWNKVGHMLFMESPAGVGYSYSAHGEIDTNDDKTADANYAALLDFLAKYPEFQGRDFYLTGESYGGVYIPTLAERIVNGTIRKEFNATFKGMAIGNGILHQQHQQNSVFYLLYYRGAIGYKQWSDLNQKCCNNPTTTCNWFKSLVPAPLPSHDKYTLSDYVSDGTECGDLAQKFSTDMIAYSQTDPYNQYQDCYKASSTKVAMLKATWQSFMAGTMGGGDSSSPVLNYDSTDPFGGYACWSSKSLTTYMRNAEVMKSFHVSDQSLPWSDCNNDFGNGSYTRTYFDMTKTVKYVVEHSEARVLIYNGDVDWVCNFLGDEWFMRDLAKDAKWNVTSDRKAWHYRGQIAGYVESYHDRVDLLTLKGSGHFVPTDRPGPALQMLANFVHNTRNYTKPYVFVPSMTTTTESPTTATLPTSTKKAAVRGVGLGLITLIMILAFRQ